MNTEANSNVRDTILLIDDDPMTTELFGEILADRCDIQVANSIKEAIEIIKTQSLSAVISDYHIGHYSAETLFIWLQKELPELAHRFMLLTGDKLADLSLFEEQATVLYKPVPINTLLDAVSRMLDANPEMMP